MSATNTKGCWIPNVATLLARLFLGALFIQMGLGKALHSIEFLKLVRQYEMVNSPFLLNLIAAGLPWFEVLCGLLLIAGIAVRGTAVLLIAMLIPFTLAVTSRAAGIAATQGLSFCEVKFDCGCGSGEVFICHKIVENTGLLMLAAWLLLGYGRQFSARYHLFSPATPGMPAQKSAGA